MDAHAASFLGYALIGCGVIVIASSHAVLFMREGYVNSSEKTPNSRSAAEHCGINIAGGLLLAAGHIMAYRIVLIDFLCGCIVDTKGPVAVVTTLLVSASCGQILSSHLIMLGAGDLPRGSSLRRHLRLTATSLSLVVLILCAKFSLGIVHYRDPYCSHSAD